MVSKFCSLCSSFPLPYLLSFKNLQKCHFLNVVSFLPQVLATRQRCNATTMVRPANHLLALRHPACTLPASHFLLLFQMEGSKIFRIILQVFQMVSWLLFSSGLFFSTGWACSLSGDHSSLQHRRLWEYQPLITPTLSPAQTRPAKSFTQIVKRTY